MLVHLSGPICHTQPRQGLAQASRVHQNVFVTIGVRVRVHQGRILVLSYLPGEAVQGDEAQSDEAQGSGFSTLHRVSGSGVSK